MISLEEPYEVAYDCDDVLWPYVLRVAEHVGIDINTWTEFLIPNNAHWPAESQKRANEIMLDPQLFREIKFDRGIKDILRPQEFGVRVKINSDSISEEIIELKKEQLYAAIPRLKPENLRMNLITLNQAKGKTLGANTLIFADDSPFNIAASTAEINVMRAWPWNVSPNARRMVAKQRCVKWFDSLEEINCFVYYQVKKFLGA